ncbi:hypothetical protein J0667_18915 [Methylomonas sp. WH-1]|uniref:hypothetical protein n=1 Tax=unclassified Methylomonas TaxID=2608980 RepID=UPI00051BEB87|nr:hypothetical protein [Methylomonas sp. LW13]
MENNAQLSLRKTYSFAKKFLIKQIPYPKAKDIVESYLNMPDKSDESVNIKVLFRSLLRSAQNANMKKNVVGGSIDGIDNLGKALFSFNPRKVEAEFFNNPEGLLDHIIVVLQPSGQIRNDSKSIWPKYCKTILSAAAFLNQFKDGEEFYDWANHFYQDERSMSALPMIIAEEIYGLGYPLACDFLKDLGFVDYGKPDVHIKDIFVGIGLCEENPSNYQVQKVIFQISKAAKVTAFDVDKVFWLIGSGVLYKHPNLDNIGRSKNDFIDEFNSSFNN